MGQATRDARFSVSSIITWRGQAESLIYATTIQNIALRLVCRLSGQNSIFGVTSGLPVIRPEPRILLPVPR
jgi:hypothetical protein